VALLQVQRRRPLRHTLTGSVVGGAELASTTMPPVNSHAGGGEYHPPLVELARRPKKELLDINSASDNQQKVAPGYRRPPTPRRSWTARPYKRKAELCRRPSCHEARTTRSRTRPWRNRTDQLAILASVRKLRYRLTERQNGNQFIPRVRDVWTVGFATRRCGVSSCGARIRSSMSRRPYLLPWLRVELLFRSIPTSGDEPTWAIVRREIPDCS
jgi:hypothetical protein